MRHRLLFLLVVFVLLFLGACRLLAPLSTNSEVTPTSPPPAESTFPTPTETLTASPVPTFTPLPTPSPTGTPDPTQQPTETPEPTFSVRFHPDWAIFVGDLVSFEVIAPSGMNLDEQIAQIEVISPEILEVGQAEFGPFGIAGRTQATFIWVWDTTDLDPGYYTLNFSIIPEGPVWEEVYFLNPQEALPSPEPWASWARAESDCCIIHYITGTEGERDLEILLAKADEQAVQTSLRMGAEFSEPIEITLLPRVLGHGGFAGREISISYLDRNYAGSDFEIVLHHEMVHILDGRLGGELRPSIFVEGLAVYLSGGHFKPEPIMQRAAALLEIPGEGENEETSWFIPLEELADQFYPSQHEIGYLQAAALVKYMVERWDWEAFSTFYRDITPHESGSQAQAINDALLRHFDLTLEQLEDDFLNELRDQLVTGDHIEDVRLTVTYFDTVRRYQRLLDPSAYFRTAWLLSNEEMRRRDIVADYIRRPEGPENISIETLLVGANENFLAGRYAETQRFLDAVNAALDILVIEQTEPASVPR